MILSLLHRALLVALAAAACYGLAERYGIGTALAVWGGIAAVACGVGVWLLRTSGVGRITWKNRLAAWLIPWGWRLNRGLLWPIPIISWITWMVIGGVAVFLFVAPSEEESAVTSWRVLLFAAWMIDAAAALYVLGSLIPNYTPGSPSGRSLIKLIAVLVGLIVVSAGLYLIHYERMAVLVAGGPPLFVAIGYGLFFGAIFLLNPKGRWN